MLFLEMENLMNTLHTGLVLEGGGIRGIYTAGVIE